MPKKYLLQAVTCAAFVLFCSQIEARSFFGRTVQMPLQKIAPGPGQILIDFQLPANHEFTKDAPSTLSARTKHAQILNLVQTKPEPLNLYSLPYSLTYTATPGNTVLVIDMRVHFCDEKIKVCLADFIRLKFPVRIEKGASSILNLHIPLKSKTAI